MESMEIDGGKTPSKGVNAGEEEKEKTKPIVLLLMGVPGSGKSTFCDEVMRISSRLWARVCQDTINNGKAGTKIQCLSLAASALKDGKSVFIDRCNIDREQRADFLKLGGPQTEKHAVVLDLPAKLCISRSVKRTGHEGNLQGGRAAAVVNQMLSKKELPKLSEGFNRITFCHDERAVKEAVNVYGSLGPLDSLPSGCFGQKNSDTKIQQGIMKFLKKADPPGNTGSEPTQKFIPNEIPVKKGSVFQRTKMGQRPSDESVEKFEKRNEVDITSTSGAISADSIPTLAFPSISTADFQFNLEKASDIIVEKVEEFISRIGNARLVLVDLSHGSKILSLVKAKAAQKNIDSNKFFTFVGDITQLHSQGGLHCNVIANAANWRLKPGGGGVNAAIFSAAGSALEVATKERASSLRPGKCVIVPLPSSSPLFLREGVTHVIHVLGPNMNPLRPDCLKDDYIQGCRILREAYASLFEGFISIVKSHGVVSKLNCGKSDEGIPTNDDQKTKREAVYESDKNKKCKGSQQDLEQKSKDKKVSKAWSSWAQALYDVALHPDKHKNVVLEMSDDVLVMNDAYPKARQHLLVLARVDGLDSIADVSREHISLLKTMHAVGLKWVDKFLSEDKSLLFRLGYHSVPSMRQLHLHVISQDFNSIHLKNKKHWNSFNTPFFLDSVDVIKEVKEAGTVTLKDDKFLAMELRCHRCRSAHPNIPRLKSHISSCQAPFPAALLQNGRLVSSEGTS
ncbi:Polynucleotide kinase 3' phosphatase [Handroanthus impetiginosus]|uniref:Polynucleotide kinase 3' phosphatase n=1 Tax=Handroanthus impetiginosus TaxID=429701 RepID=A0A2G9HQQ8_9LAMI|nr:Polynucleotide kinase 3' phosphatase [Handroanthus impetiginosus]